MFLPPVLATAAPGSPQSGRTLADPQADSTFRDLLAAPSTAPATPAPTAPAQSANNPPAKNEQRETAPAKPGPSAAQSEAASQESWSEEPPRGETPAEPAETPTPAAISEDARPAEPTTEGPVAETEVEIVLTAAVAVPIAAPPVEEAVAAAIELEGTATRPTVDAEASPNSNLPLPAEPQFDPEVAEAVQRPSVEPPAPPVDAEEPAPSTHEPLKPNVAVEAEDAALPPAALEKAVEEAAPLVLEQKKKPTAAAQPITEPAADSKQPPAQVPQTVSPTDEPVEDSALERVPVAHDPAEPEEAEHEPLGSGGKPPRKQSTSAAGGGRDGATSAQASAKPNTANASQPASGATAPLKVDAVVEITPASSETSSPNTALTPAEGTASSGVHRTAEASRPGQASLLQGSAETEPVRLNPVERGEFVQRVARAVQRAHEGDGAIRLRLSPPQLG